LSHVRTATENEGRCVLGAMFNTPNIQPACGVSLQMTYWAGRNATICMPHIFPLWVAVAA